MIAAYYGRYSKVGFASVSRKGDGKMISWELAFQSSLAAACFVCAIGVSVHLTCIAGWFVIIAFFLAEGNCFFYGFESKQNSK